MRKAAFIAIALFLGVIVLSVGQTGQKTLPSATNLVTKSFGRVYLETLELNRHRFTDINKIDIGDSVLVAANSSLHTLRGSTTENMIASGS